MHGVGPSTVLGGRYAVQRRLEQLPKAERWSAHDTTLERDVVIVCFSEHEAHADTTLDAARRAAGLDNHRLVRVLDSGVKPAGRHTATWNGTDTRGVPVPPGVYYAKFRVGGFEKTTKVVVIG